MTNFLGIVHHNFSLKRRFKNWTLSAPLEEAGTNSIDWVQHNKFYLPDDGDRVQSPKRLFK
jgi:hypothetical protein